MFYLFLSHVSMFQNSNCITFITSDIICSYLNRFFPLSLSFHSSSSFFHFLLNIPVELCFTTPVIPVSSKLCHPNENEICDHQPLILVAFLQKKALDSSQTHSFPPLSKMRFNIIFIENDAWGNLQNRVPQMRFYESFSFLFSLLTLIFCSNNSKFITGVP